MYNSGIALHATCVLLFLETNSSAPSRLLMYILVKVFVLHVIYMQYTSMAADLSLKMCKGCLISDRGKIEHLQQAAGHLTSVTSRSDQLQLSFMCPNDLF